MNRRLWTLAVALMLAPPIPADVISFTGDLRADATFLPPGGPSFSDADYAQWAAVIRNFHVASASAMTALSFSYGGGTNGSGELIAPNGFEPYLSLFDGSGSFLASTFFGVTCPVGAEPNPDTGFCFDVQLDGGTLAQGDYQLAISAFSNMSFAENLGAGNLSDGFTGLGTLLPGEDLHYAVDVILGPEAIPTPEPATLPLLTAAIATFYLIRRRRRQDR
jgi:hypothetical protein